MVVWGAMPRVLLVLAFLLAIARADAPKYQLDGNNLVVPFPVAFETGKATLTPESDKALAYVKGYLDAKPDITLLRIEVHTDASGDAAAGQALTEDRAHAVAVALVAKGIDCQRVLPVGFGATKPVADNGTPDGKAANRRTVFANAQLRKRAIGGQPVEGGGKISRGPALCH